MGKLKKRHYILISIILIVLIYLIGMYNYRKPIYIHKVFNDAVETKSGSKEVLKKTSIELKANLTRGVYKGSIIHFDAKYVNELEGTITIENKEYYFNGYSQGPKGTNIRGYLYENKESNIIVYFLSMYDLDSIILMGWDGNDHNYRADNHSK